MVSLARRLVNLYRIMHRKRDREGHTQLPLVRPRSEGNQAAETLPCTLARQ